MQETIKVCALVVLCFATASQAICQERNENASIELLAAAKLADARSSGQPFRISAAVRLEQGKAEPHEGTYVLVWDSPTRWREEFSFPDFHQVRVSAPGGVWEKREPAFLSLRVWQVMQALGFYGRFELSSEETAGRVKRVKKDGMDLRCVEIKWNSYLMDQLCFGGDVPQLVTEHYLPSNRTYEFGDYRKVRAKFFPGHIKVLDGKTLAAEFLVSGMEEPDNLSAASFKQPAQAEWRPWCPSPQSGGDPLTPIYSGLGQHKGTDGLRGHRH